MFACLFQPSSQQNLFAARAEHEGVVCRDGEGPMPPLEALAREFSPRVQAHKASLVSLDIAGLGRMLGPPPEIAGELKRVASDRGLSPHVAVAPTRTAAMLLALARPGVTVVPPGGERAAVAALPLSVLRQVPVGGLRAQGSGLQASGFGLPAQAEGRRSKVEGRIGLMAQGSGPRDVLPAASDPLSADDVIALLRRWGLKTLGELAGLPSRPLSERLGQQGVLWQRLARGEDVQPLIAGAPEVPIEETVDLEWPVEGLEPLSFVLARLCEPLSERLASLDLAAVVLRLSFRLASRETETRELQLPAPMRDPKVLRTLILLHLESHPLSGGVDRLTLRVDTAPARVTQFSLLSRARPFPEQMATLLARLSALLGENRVGAAALVDSHRPGAFVMARFSGGSEKPGHAPIASQQEPHVALRRFRVPVPARVMVKDGRPARVTTDRRGLDGGVVTGAAGPWRTSGDWWRIDDGRAHGEPVGGSRPATGSRMHWNRDEWDVGLSDGAVYRIYRDRSQDRWFVDGIVD